MVERYGRIETWALLLRELTDNWTAAFVIVGEEGILDGLSVAMFFAGWSRGRNEFSGGIYLLAEPLEEFKSDFSMLCGKNEGPDKLIIIDDGKFPDDYSLDVSTLLGDRVDISLIILARDKSRIHGNHGDITIINLSGESAKILDLFTLAALSDSHEPNPELTRRFRRDQRQKRN